MHCFKTASCFSSWLWEIKIDKKIKTIATAFDAAASFTRLWHFWIPSPLETRKTEPRRTTLALSMHCSRSLLEWNHRIPGILPCHYDPNNKRRKQERKKKFCNNTTVNIAVDWKHIINLKVRKLIKTIAKIAFKHSE